VCKVEERFRFAGVEENVGWHQRYTAGFRKGIMSLVGYVQAAMVLARWMMRAWMFACLRVCDQEVDDSSGDGGGGGRSGPRSGSGSGRQCSAVQRSVAMSRKVGRPGRPGREGCIQFELLRFAKEEGLNTQRSVTDLFAAVDSVYCLLTFK
jgi:hypothetical protein